MEDEGTKTEGCMMKDQGWIGRGKMDGWIDKKVPNRAVEVCQEQQKNCIITVSIKNDFFFNEAFKKINSACL